jgi:hypothetical protein
VKTEEESKYSADKETLSVNINDDIIENPKLTACPCYTYLLKHLERQ